MKNALMWKTFFNKNQVQELIKNIFPYENEADFFQKSMEELAKWQQLIVNNDGNIIE